jgi:hypothetical protein
MELLQAHVICFDIGKWYCVLSTIVHSHTISFDKKPKLSYKQKKIGFKSCLDEIVFNGKCEAVVVPLTL